MTTEDARKQIKTMVCPHCGLKADIGIFYGGNEYCPLCVGDLLELKDRVIKELQIEKESVLKTSMSTTGFMIDKLQEMHNEEIKKLEGRIKESEGENG